MKEHTEDSKIYRLIMMEWITMVALMLSCFGYLTYKIDKQSDRTDRLYEMFIEIVKEKK